MHQKCFLIMGIFLFVLFTSNFTNALSSIPYPSCFVKGEILNVTFAEAIDYSEPNLPLPSYPDRFILNILINEVELSAERDESFSTCDDLYPVGEVSEIYIPATDVLNENDLKASELIEGEVRNVFGAYFTGHSVEKQKDFSLIVGIVIAFIVLLIFLRKKI